MSRTDEPLIVGISAYYHDSAAVLLRGGKVVAACQEERFSRRRHDPSFPARSLRWILTEHRLRLSDVDAIAYYEKPLLKFERLIETFYHAAPRGWGMFVAAMPGWVRHKLLLRKTLGDALLAIKPQLDLGKTPLLFSEHHLSHAASAFYASPFERAAILTLDGVGEWTTGAIGTGGPEGIRFHRETSFPHSVGLFYSAVTAYLGFRVLSGEYKVMGLAPYGVAESAETQRLIEALRTQLVRVYADGSVWLNPAAFDFTSLERMVRSSFWQHALGMPPRRPESALTQAHANLALAAQLLLEEIVLAQADYARRLTELPHLVMAGGVALNAVANTRVSQSEKFERVFIQPAAGDAGGALGAAYAAHHLALKHPRRIPADIHEALSGAYLGPSFTDDEVKRMARRLEAPYTVYDSEEALLRAVALRLSEGAVVGWCQGAMEWGPRALGNRSIIADPRRSDAQEQINGRVKRRESFRPFAPAVRWERAREVFQLTEPSPYMLFTPAVDHAYRKKRPADWASLPLEAKRAAPRSTWPSVVHVDYSARVQTVHPQTNPRFWQLLLSFERLTDCPVLLNTSFNLRGEPMVCTPDDAYRCFRRGGLDLLVFGNILFDARNQPPWTEGEPKLLPD